MTKIELPIKPYLKKYLVKKIGDPVNVSFTDSIGFGLFTVNSLQNKREFYLMQNDEYMGKFTENITDSITLIINNRFSLNCGLFLNDEKVYYINKWLQKQFVNEMFANINSLSMYMPNGMLTMTHVIDNFCSVFGINEDDVAKDTILQLYKRHRKKYFYIQEKVKNQTNIST